ncbi:MAG: HAMP domain-containing histidine kinase [Erysipelotrichaceae bacterium]|nr:HAMP domain-containing histidine kinase [Erysipelotrichaceae bacterium]
MKRFIKTVTGKTVLFILCVISLAVLLLSALSAVFFVEEDFYVRNKEEIYEDIIDYRIDRDIYNVLCQAIDQKREETLTMKDQGNLVFQIKDEEYHLVAVSESAGKLNSFEGTDSYCVFYDKEGYITDVVKILYTPGDEVENGKIYHVDHTILNKPGITDFYSLSGTLLTIAYALRYGVYVIILISVLLGIVCFITLMNVSGRINDSDEIHPGPLNNIPFDLLCAVSFLAFALYCLFCGSVHWPTIVECLLIALGFLFAVNGLLGLCMSMACRIKQKTLWKKSFLRWILVRAFNLILWIFDFLHKIYRRILSFIRQIPLVWKTAVVFLGLTLVELIILVNSYSDFYTLFWLLKNFILFMLVIWIALSLRKLQTGGKSLAMGDLSYHIDTRGMLPDLREHGEDLNSIAKGMAIAVEDRLKSERMKTELITNVSHDIKTPLTSIINYADLISKEKSTTKKVKEYADVLLRQSERLKRLLEDLVEASKAATGNLEVDLMPCDAGTLVSQVSGEYEDRLKQASLSLIVNQPEEEIMIMADSRRMWRIFDNLMNNICKYAQPDTRVYLSLEKIDQEAVFTFRNTSRDPLNISEEELMERFTRGDASRHTEGNGLGLSIARSLAQLQKGSLKLSIDGDLFKAILSFPVLK